MITTYGKAGRSYITLLNDDIGVLIIAAHRCHMKVKRAVAGDQIGVGPLVAMVGLKLAAGFWDAA